MSEIELLPGSVKSAMKAVGASSSDLWKVSPHLIKVLPGYNARIRNENYNQVVQEIKSSILANGFYVDKPLSGYVNKAEDGSDEIILIGGHRRLEAVLLAIAEGAEITEVPVVIKPRGTSVEDLLVDLKTGNDGNPLTVLEQAIVCQRLAAFNWSSQTIATRLGYTSQRVDELLLLASAPAKIRDHVAADRISASLAIKLLVQHGTKAKDFIERLINGTKDKKVTAANVPDMKFQASLRKQAKPLFEAVNKVQLDPAFSSLGKDTRDLIQKLIKELNKK